MYPYLLQSMAVERVKDLRSEATGAGGAGPVRRTRSVRAGTRLGLAASSAAAGLVRRVVHP
jgi:hypothetical protein